MQLHYDEVMVSLRDSEGEGKDLRETGELPSTQVQSVAGTPSLSLP